MDKTGNDSEESTYTEKALRYAQRNEIKNHPGFPSPYYKEWPAAIGGLILIALSLYLVIHHHLIWGIICIIGGLALVIQSASIGSEKDGFIKGYISREKMCKK